MFFAKRTRTFNSVGNSVILYKLLVSSSADINQAPLINFL